MKFNKLDVPYQWKDEFTKYPHGYTIFEALCSWTKQVDKMVDNINDWNDYLDNFVENFEFELQEEVQSTITRWQNEGLLDGIIESALNTELDNVKDQLSETIQELDNVKDHLSETIQELDNVKDHLSETIQDLEQREINVKKYGAKGDGITDDSQAIRDAVAVGGRVFFPPGNYYIGSSINIPPETHLIGTQKSKIIIASGVSCFVIDKANHITIEDFSAIQDGEGGNFITIKNSSSRVSVKNIHCSGVDYPVIIDYSWIIDISALRVQGCKCGVKGAPQANAVRIYDSVINNASEYGVSFNNSEAVSFTNVAFHNNNIALRLGNYSWGASIIGCYFESNVKYNIYINATLMECRGIVIQGNHIEQVRGDGSRTHTDIYIRYTDGISIISNEFKPIEQPENEYRILLYDVNPSPNKNVVIFGNSFGGGDKNIASTVNYENQTTFPTDFHEQPYGLV